MATGEVAATATEGLLGALSSGGHATDVTKAVTQSLSEIKYLEEQLIKAKQENEKLRNELRELNDTVFSKSLKPPSAWADREHKYLLEKQEWDQKSMILEKKAKRLQADIAKIKQENRSTEYEATIEKLKKEKLALQKDRDAARHEEHELKLQLMNSTGEFVKEGGESSYGRSEETPHMEAKSMIQKLEALSGNDKSKVAHILNKALHLEDTDEMLDGQGRAGSVPAVTTKAPSVASVDTLSEESFTPLAPRDIEELNMARAEMETLKQQVTQFKALLSKVTADKERMVGELGVAWSAAQSGDPQVLGELCQRLGVAEASSATTVPQVTDDAASSATDTKATYSHEFVQFVRAISLKPGAGSEVDDSRAAAVVEALDGDAEIMDRIKKLKEERDQLRSELGDAKAEVANTFFKKEAELFTVRRELLAKLEEIEKLQSELKRRKALQLQLERENHRLKLGARGASTFRSAAASVPTASKLPEWNNKFINFLKNFNGLDQAASTPLPAEKAASTPLPAEKGPKAEKLATTEE